jgi:autotransporter-associated beta strand protein
MQNLTRAPHLSPSKHRPRLALLAALALVATVALGFGKQVFPGRENLARFAAGTWFAELLPERLTSLLRTESAAMETLRGASESATMKAAVAAPALAPASVVNSSVQWQSARPVADEAPLPAFNGTSSFSAVPANTLISAPKSATTSALVSVIDSTAAFGPTWIGSSGGVWSQASNWNPATVPNAVGAIADYAPTVASSSSMLTNQDSFSGVTVGTLSLSGTGARAWALLLNGNITLNNNGNGALLTNTNTGLGSSALMVNSNATQALVLADNLSITNSSASNSSVGSIVIYSRITGTGNITINNVSNDPNAGAIALAYGGPFIGTSTFTGTSTIASGAVDIERGDAFGNSSNAVILGTAGGGSATLVQRIATDLQNPITVTGGTGGTLVLGSIANNTNRNSGTSYFSGPINLKGDVSLTSGTTAGAFITFNGAISGVGGITKIGPGTVVLSNSNTFTGSTVINAGTLELAIVSALGGTSSITVNSGGTLLLNSTFTSRNTFVNAAPLILNGNSLTVAALQTNGVSAHGTLPNSAGIGPVTLQSNSVIDLTRVAPVIVAFADSSAQTWSGTLSIWNYHGTPLTGNGMEQVAFGNNAAGLTPLQLSQINFYSDSGTTFLGTATWAPDLDGEIVPVPEMSTWISAALALGFIAFTQRRKLRGLAAGRA